MSKKSKPNLQWIKINDLLIKDHDDKYPINEHIYYKALRINNGKLYEKKTNKSKRQKVKKSATWKEFNKLKDNIKYNGFKLNKSPLIIRFDKDKPFVSHGRHRITLLRYLYGKNLSFLVQIKNRIGKIVDLNIKNDIYSHIDGK